MKQRVELPYKVYFHSYSAGVTRRRDGRLQQITSMHFATKDEAIKFCGNERLVKYAPGEAWTMREV